MEDCPIILTTKQSFLLQKNSKMACLHKFHNYLNLERLNFEPTTLIVGTFNPEWPEGNYAEWFYGRTDNNYFWDLLPGMFRDEGLRNQNHVEWKTYCRTRKVALTDLISSIDDADLQIEKHRKILGKYTDSAIASKFRQQVPNPIVPLLQAIPTIKAVYLTTTINTGLWQNLWNPVEEYSNVNKLWCRKLMTPSKGARFFMTKGLGIKMPVFIYNDWETKWRYHT
jgi:hypothetical protein